MGCYVNTKQDKVDWLGDNGKLEFVWMPGIKPNLKPYQEYCKDNKLPVMVADNGPFTAAGVCFNEKEWQAFTLENDDRLRVCYTVDIEKLKTVSPLKNYLEK